MTLDEKHAVLSALIDREPIDPDALAAALEDSTGRALLVDFVRLRVKIQREDTSPEGVITSVTPPRRSHVRFWRLAAAALLPLALGLAGGAWWTEHRDATPPEPDRIIQFQPGVDWQPGTLSQR